MYVQMCVRWICCFLWSVLVLYFLFYIFHAWFCVNFHLLTLSQWNLSERPEKTVRRCGCVAWYGRAWHGRWCALMLVKCFEPDAQMHLHLICVTFCALDYFWMLDASVKLCFMKYSNSGSSINSWKKAENKSQTVSSPDFLLIGERERERKTSSSSAAQHQQHACSTVRLFCFRNFINSTVFFSLIFPLSLLLWMLLVFLLLLSSAFDVDASSVSFSMLFKCVRTNTVIQHFKIR